MKKIYFETEKQRQEYYDNLQNQPLQTNITKKEKPKTKKQEKLEKEVNRVNFFLAQKDLYLDNKIKRKKLIKNIKTYIQDEYKNENLAF